MLRVGQGYDVHRLVEGRKLILGGVKIENEKGLLGHSDADVLTHSIIDSMLGAAGLGDIGGLFPPEDSKYLGADSLKLLEIVYQKLVSNNCKIINIDSTIVAQRPKLGGYVTQMRENIAQVIKIDKKFVSVKATTEEGLGFTGTSEGISAHAICLLDCLDI